MDRSSFEALFQALKIQGNGPMMKFNAYFQALKIQTFDLEFSLSFIPMLEFSRSRHRRLN